MGGGDLNTKKSWHPNTMKNQERVWKAEQQEAAEKRRLNELRREIDAERSREELKSMAQKSGVIPDSDGADKKLEWMYSGPSQLVNREEYLLGRTIDKTFEELDAQEKAATSNSAFGVAQPKNHVEHECIPFSIRQHKGVLSNDQVDLARKLMEDPLMLIKQKEMESRQKLLQNPVKLKELHRLLKSDRRLQEGKEEKGSKTKAKKSKKSKKGKKSSKQKRKKSRKEGSSDSGSDSDEAEGVDLDQLLAEKYKKVQHSMAEEHPEGRVSIDKLLTMKYEKLSKELDKMGNGKKKKKGKRHRNEHSSSERSAERSNHRRSRSSSPQRRKQRKGSRDRHERESDPSRGSKRDHDRYKSATSSRRSRSRSRDKKDGPSSSRGYPRQPAKDRDERRRETGQRNADRARSRSRSNERRPRNARSRSRTPRTKSPNQLKTKQRNSSPDSSRSSDESSSSENSTPPRQAFDSEEEKRMRKVKNFGLVTASGQKLETKAGVANVRLYNREEIKAEQSKQKPTWSKPTERKRPLTEEELEEKRRAMQDNARWREKDRANNVKRYEAEDHREDARHGGRDYDKEFLTKQFKRAAASETVESRIRSNRNNIQRSRGAMDSNFAKR